MDAKRTRDELDLSPEDVEKLRSLSVSRTARHDQVTRARILLAYHEGQRKSAIARDNGISRPTVDLCLHKAICGGIEFALRDLPRLGQESKITADDKTWVTSVACAKPTDYGYASETWTRSKLAEHVRKNAEECGHASLSRAGKATVHRILKENEIKPDKTAYYLEKRDPDFDEKMAEVLLVYKEIEQFRLRPKGDADRREVNISYDEKPGIQAIANIAADLAPVPHKYPRRARDYEYKRLGTISLLAGLDLHTGHVHAVVRDRHRSSEFIEFLEEIDRYYPSDWRIKVLLDNHSAHTSKEVMTWLGGHPNRFAFVFTPKHASWLNIVEVFFSKMTRSFLRGMRVQSKEELVTRIYRYMAEINEYPVIFRWKYKMDELSL